MAETDIKTLLSLDRWAQIIGLDPRHFRQVTTEYKPNTTCTKVWKEHAWQEQDQVSREDVLNAIQQAEIDMSLGLGYKVMPTWEISEIHQTPKPADVSLYNRYAMDPQLFNLSVKLTWGQYITGGREAKTLIDADVAVVYSDVDGDGYEETATISFATTVTDCEELAVFYPGETGADKWEIRPFRTCSITAGTATMTFWKHQLVLPDLIEALSPEAVNGDDNTQFLTTVDAYRRYNDPSLMAWLIWDPRYGDCGVACAQTTQAACLIPRNYETSMIGYQAASWDDVEEAYTAAELTIARNPDQIQVCYRAGFRDMQRDYPYLQMEPEFERAVAYYALSLLKRELCGCSNIEATFTRWTEDMALLTPGGSRYNISDDVKNNPFGTTRAAQLVYRLIRQRRLASAINY